MHSFGGNGRPFYVGLTFREDAAHFLNSFKPLIRRVASGHSGIGLALAFGLTLFTSRLPAQSAVRDTSAQSMQNVTDVTGSDVTPFSVH